VNQPLTIYSGQFALLRHWAENSPPAAQCDTGHPCHWDLLLETDSDHLLTWRLDWVPDRQIMAGQPPMAISGRRLAGHRRLYLDYEGPISGDRGCVTKVMTGKYRAVLSCLAEFRLQWLTDTVATGLEADSERPIVADSVCFPLSDHDFTAACQPLGRQYLWILLIDSPRECLIAVDLTEVGQPATITVRHWNIAAQTFNA
jgi:hypothetical protein